MASVRKRKSNVKGVWEEGEVCHLGKDEYGVRKSKSWFIPCVLVFKMQLAMDVFICSLGRDVYTSFSRSCLMGGGRQERRMRALRVAGSSALSG